MSNNRRARNAKKSRRETSPVRQTIVGMVLAGGLNRRDASSFLRILRFFAANLVTPTNNVDAWPRKNAKYAKKKTVAD